MNIFITGVNYRTTPIQYRENLSFSRDEQQKILTRLKEIPGVLECVLLSTCNRSEVYIYADNCDFNGETVEKLLCEVKGLLLYEYKKFFYFYSSIKAVKHLFQVASGLESQVLGEDQILGQVKDAHRLSMELKASAGVLNTLFRDAVTAAKKVKTYTDLSKNSLSVGSLAAKLVEQTLHGKLQDKKALIIGMGKIGSLALKNLIALGIGKVYVTNRTHGKYVKSEFSARQGIEFVPYQDRYSVLNEADIVISSTSSPHYTITRDMVEKSVAGFKERIFIDLAVPRDMDVSVSEIPGIKYFNMDDLKITIDENVDKRLLEVTKANEIIDAYVLEYEKWFKFKGYLPLINELQKYVEEILNGKITETLSKLECASESDKEMVRSSISGSVKKILNKFIFSIRDVGSKEEIEAYFKCLNDILTSRKL
ncbi:MAG: glutamyl-tRNA reductase [Clostridia bacterium]|nr:glutamyl-tRNA reductase [Clostridia bacterium]